MLDELRGVIDIAHQRGLLIIGQRIEDPQAAAAMWMSGVDFIQGNLVSLPLRPQAFREWWLRTQRG